MDPDSPKTDTIPSSDLKASIPTAMAEFNAQLATKERAAIKAADIDHKLKKYGSTAK